MQCSSSSDNNNKSALCSLCIVLWVSKSTNNFAINMHTKQERRHTTRSLASSLYIIVVCIYASRCWIFSSIELFYNQHSENQFMCAHITSKSNAYIRGVYRNGTNCLVAYYVLECISVSLRRVSEMTNRCRHFGCTAVVKSPSYSWPLVNNRCKPDSQNKEPTSIK